MNFMDIRKTEIRIEHTTFRNNTGSYSMFEVEHSLPFYKVLTAERHRLNYVRILADAQVESDKDTNICEDEFMSVGAYDCFVKDNIYRMTLQPKSSMSRYRLHMQQPHTMGSIYLRNINRVVITHNAFTLNDVGPIIEYN